LGLEATLLATADTRSIEGNLGLERADSYHRDLHKRSHQGGTDYILAKPPFKMSDWGGDRLREDARWKFGVPPPATPTMPGCNTSSTTPRPRAWPASSSPNGSMSSNTSGECAIRKAIIEADLVDCVVALKTSSWK
jgi:type I restriction enzyme M protein